MAKRKTSKKKYSRKKKKGKSSATSRAVKQIYTKRRAARYVKRKAVHRLNRSMNSLSSMSKTYSFSSYLERHMVPSDNYYLDDTNQNVSTAGILCGSKNAVAPSFGGQLQIALRAGPGGFFDASIPVSNFRSINSRVDDVFSQWKSFKIISTTWRFEPVDSGRGYLDTQIPTAASTKNTTSSVDFRNLLAWFVIDQGNRDIDTSQLVGTAAWQVCER